MLFECLKNVDQFLNLFVVFIDIQQQAYFRMIIHNGAV